MGLFKVYSRLGGQEGLLTYFKEGFVYPKELSEAGVEGKVMLSFVVNED